jgi:hypothetical protein
MNAVAQAGSWVAVSCAVAVGCISEPKPPSIDCSGEFYAPVVRATQLADLPRLKPSIRYQGTSGRDRVQTNSEMTIWLKYGMGFNPVRVESVAPIFDGDTLYCAQLDPTFKATLDGVELPRVDAGEWRCYGPSGPGCVAPTLQLSAPAASPDATLVLSDRSTTLTLALGDLLAERTATPPGGNWSFLARQTVSVQWSPATDLASSSPGASVSQPCPACPSGVTYTPLDAQIVPGSGAIEFALPDIVGDGTIAVGLINLEVDRTTYVIEASQAYLHDATFTRIALVAP